MHRVANTFNFIKTSVLGVGVHTELLIMCEEAQRLIEKNRVRLSTRPYIGVDACYDRFIKVYHILANKYIRV